MATDRKVIIAVDSSDVSAFAFTWAVTNFFKPTDKVLILTAQEYLPASSLPTVDIAAGGEYAVPLVVENDEAEEVKMADLAKALVDKYMRQCEQTKIPCEGEVVRGDPGSHICSEAKRISADVIIVGTHGYGIFKRTFLGSISDYVLHHAEVPVITVRSPGENQHDPLSKAGLNRTFVIAVDESKESVYAFTWALQNLCTENDKVIILHVQSPLTTIPTSIGVDQFGLEEVYVPPDTSMKDDVSQLNYSESLVEKYMQYASSETKIHCEGRVVSGSTEEKVCDELTVLEADAVVVGTHNASAMAKTFLGSVSDYLAHNSPCPVVVAKKVEAQADVQEVNIAQKQQ